MGDVISLQKKKDEKAEAKVREGAATNWAELARRNEEWLKKRAEERAEHNRKVLRSFRIK